ncbi:hydrolase 1, exosortase A system-associated [Azoarcus olearius]|uniref:Serine aminopeptidase S33 domain-containing protein n=1 Tax=Azoarcus sp. (strain BH72) TaxID=418699 RepID=A1KAL0_AZOSB|nr:hydrolase 1, exosortase A system-associated [Azoarcus olearius]CAL95866.1 conserved hypothetical protein [Azoarcus olearius]
MTFRELALLFECGGDELVGVLSLPEREGGEVGVLVVVGGPQYRAGSHRQFVLLARHLAANGIPCMRFDYRGMGDATGEQRDFEQVQDDIRCAVDTMMERIPGLRGVVLWGLCDGASASCFYAREDDRVLGTMLLNPWVRTAATEARTYLTHYYWRRLRDPAFWKKLLGGGVLVGKALGGLLGTARKAGAARQGTGQDPVQSLPARMASGLASAGKPYRVVLSGRDYVAREFEQVAAGKPWAALEAIRDAVRLDEADHTFSTAAWRAEVARVTAEWVESMGREGAR